MSSYSFSPRPLTRTLLDQGPCLVSELPATSLAEQRPSRFARYRTEFAARREFRAFEHDSRNVSRNEYRDLLVARRRD